MFVDSGGSESSCRLGGGGSGGPLSLLVSLLTSSPVSLDLNALVDLLQLAGTLFAGCLLPVDCYTCLCVLHASEQCKNS